MTESTCTCGHHASRHEIEMPYPCYDCECGGFVLRPSLAAHIKFAIGVFICGAFFSAAILAHKEDVDALWGILEPTAITREAK